MKIHCSGVGGIGMSALARYYMSQGFSVSGSDSTRSDIVRELEEEGMLFVPSDETFSTECGFHVYSQAVACDDIQRAHALENNILSFSYFQALGEVSQGYKTIAICGTHGKSTTTAMIGIAAKNMKQPSMTVVGTKVKEFDGKNFYTYEGDDKVFIVEACEYKRNFLHISPSIVVLLNCEHDHHDTYKTFQEYQQAFLDFCHRLPKDGVVIANIDDTGVCCLLPRIERKVISVSLENKKDIITPQVPGRHNQSNAEMAAAALRMITNNKEEEINKSLSDFSGTWRRFDILGHKEGIEYIDDYGHHPTEIKVTLIAFDEYAKSRRKIIMFQPHQYARTRNLFDDFITSFSLLANTNTKLFITDIYEARDTEEDKKAVNAKMLVEAIKKTGVDVEYIGDYELAYKKIEQEQKSGDVILSLGAGPINTVIKKLL